MEQVRLYQSTSWDTALREAVLPELESLELDTGRVSTIVLPYGAWAAYIKSQLLERGHSLLGVHIWTPGQLRQFLTNKIISEQITLSDTSLSLLASLAAQSCQGSFLSRPIRQSPEGFVRLCASFQIAGYRLADMPSADIQEIASSWASMLKNLNAQSLQQADRHLLKASLTSPQKCLQHLYFLGFSGRDWGLYSLIRSAMQSAVSSTLFLPLDRIALHDQLWTGTWENLFGACETLSEGDSFEIPLALDFMEPKHPSAVSTYFAQHAFDEAKIIAKKALECLSNSASGKTGIVVPGRNVLARELANILNAEKIPHYNALGFASRHGFGDDVAQAWTCWQDQGTVSAYLIFTQSLYLAGLIEDEALLFGAEKALRQGTENTLTEDFDLVSTYLFRRKGALDLNTFELLKQYKRLPEKGIFREFFDATLVSLQAWGILDGRETLVSEGKHLSIFLEEVLSRSVYLQWLGAQLQSCAYDRGPYGTHVCSRLYIIDPEQADGLDWGHLILADTGDSSWFQETKDTHALLGSEALFSHNKKNIVQGTQGLGHTSMCGDHAFILSHNEKREEARARLTRLFESARTSLTLTASLSEAGKPEAWVPPNPQFSSLYSLGGCTLSGVQNPKELCAQGAAYIDGFLKEPPVDLILKQKIHAPYFARRDASREFGPYEYCLNEGKRLSFIIPGRGWEDAVKKPSQAWYQHVLKLRLPWHFSHKSVRAIARGIWVHDWLTMHPASSAFIGRPEMSVWEASAEDKAKTLKATILSAAEASNKKLSDWWVFEWERSRLLAQKFIAVLSAEKTYPFLAQEVSFPEDCALTLGNARVPVHGRMDLVFSDRASSQNSTLWIIDFKTGSQQALSKNRLLKGEGLQLAMYALGLSSLGGAQIETSILSANEKGSVPKPQLNLSDLLELKPLWKVVEKIHTEGTFGQRFDIKDRFSNHAQFPLATLSIERNVLDQKWKHTHPEYLEG